jgi:hypothetical protein
MTGTKMHTDPEGTIMVAPDDSGRDPASTARGHTIANVGEETDSGS